MAPSPRVYHVFNRGETQVTGDTGAPGLQLALATYVAQNDETALSVLVHVALSGEPNLTAGTSAQLAGMVRLKILRSGQQANVVVPDPDWHEVGSDTANSIADDRDVGETWAMQAFAISSTVGGANGPAMIVLSPKTKRKLGRGDSIVVDLHYSNSGSSNFVLAHSVTGTLVTLT